MENCKKSWVKGANIISGSHLLKSLVFKLFVVFLVFLQIYSLVILKELLSADCNIVPCFLINVMLYLPDNILFIVQNCWVI